MPRSRPGASRREERPEEVRQQPAGDLPRGIVVGSDDSDLDQRCGDVFASTVMPGGEKPREGAHRLAIERAHTAVRRLAAPGIAELLGA